MILDKSKIIVIGDIILDQYNIGSVTRISPESPVPVINMSEKYYRLGGAANVVNNIIQLGGIAALIGVIGNDFAGEQVKRLLENNKTICDGLIVEDSYHTIKKVRVLGNNQQVVRMDYFEKQDFNENIWERLFFLFSKMLSSFDVVIISDYSKGICRTEYCQKIINFCKKNHKPVLVDPKGNNWSKYWGATLISPNVKEIGEYLNKTICNDDQEIENNCYSLYETLMIDYLMITRSEKGITLIDKKDNIFHLPSKAKEVYDVSGAGDTVIATLGLFWNQEKNILETVRLANEAAGVVVGKRGTSTISYDELEKASEKNQNHLSNKIVSRERLKKIVEKWKQNDEDIVFTNGCFDIIHKGHIKLLYEASRYGKHLIVAINADKSVQRLKGPQRPVNLENDRAYIIAALGCVDNVVIFEEDTPEILLSEVEPDVLVKGSDYKIDGVLGKEYVKRVVLVDYIEGYSTSKTLEKIDNKNY